MKHNLYLYLFCKGDIKQMFKKEELKKMFINFPKYLNCINKHLTYIEHISN